MRPITLALVVGLAMAPAARADQATVQSPGLTTWPDAGPFVTALMTLPNGALVCIFGLKAAPLASAGGANVGFTVWLQRGSTHLYLSYQGADRPDVKTLTFYDHGQVLAELPVAKRLLIGASVAHMADLPGDLWAATLAPHIAGGGVELELGTVRLPVPADGFAQASAYLGECLQRLAADAP